MAGFRGIACVAFSPDGKQIATASRDSTARVWELASGHELVCVKHASRVTGVAFSPDGKQIATASRDSTARVWEVASGHELTRVTHASRSASGSGGSSVVNSQVLGVAFSPDGKQIATASQDSTARVWEVASGHELTRVTHAGQVLGVVFSPDGNQIATASSDNTARIWGPSRELPTT
jgi:WD40 repeat protein